MSDNQQFCLRWNNHQSTLVQVIDSLLSSGLLVDCTLAAEGQYLHAHKVILCACSPYLETLLSQHYEKHPIVILKDVKFQELKSMMDYMYKGEVNISQDQLGQFLKAAESLQIKGLTDGGGGENDSKDVGSTSHKRHDPPPIRKSVPPNQSRSSVVLPSHASGLTIEPSKRSLPSHLSESQPDSPIRSREGSSSPTPRKRRRPRRPSQGDDDGHQDNCDLPMQQQSILNTVPIIPQLPAGSSSTITKAPPPDEETDQPAESDVRLAESGLLKEKIEPQSELLIEPKTEYMEETNNDDSVEDLTLDDDDDYDNMDAAGPSHGGDNSNQSYGQWQMGERTHDEVFMAAQEAVGGGPRDSQGESEYDLIASDVVEVTQSAVKTTSSALRRILKNIGASEHAEYRSSGSKRGKKSVICKAGCCTDSRNDSAEHSKKRFTPYQVEVLKKEFIESPYISQSQAALIARKIGLKKLQVRKWFSDYRCKIKKQSVSMEDESSLSVGFAQSENQPYDKDEGESDAEEISVVDDDYPSVDYRCGSGLRKKLKKRSKKDTEDDDDEQTNKKRFSPHQVEMLKKAFENSPYITQSEAAVIARNTGLKKMQVRKWFCDYRCKIKKQSLRLQRLQMLEDEKSKDGKFTKRQLSIRRLMRFHEQSRNENDTDIDVQRYESKKVRVGRKKRQDFGFNFTEDQMKILNEEFLRSQFINEERLTILAERIQEKKTTIKNWFTNKRYKTAESEQKFWTDLIEGTCDT